MSVIFSYIQRTGWSKKFQFIGLASLLLLQVVVSADGTKSTSLFIENKDGVMSLRSNLRGLSTQNIAKDVPDFLSHGKLSSILMNNFEDMAVFTSSEEIQLAWEDSVLFEWYRAEQEEERMGALHLEGTEDVVRGTTSFLICVSGSESGYNRKEILEKTIASLAGNSATLDKYILYNKDDFTCVFSSMTASEARMVQQDNDNIIVQPLPALTKISVNALYSMRNDIDPDDRTSTVLMSFCPGVDESTALAENLVHRVQVGLDASSMSTEGSGRKLISEDFLWTSPQINEDGMNTSWITRRALVYRSILDKVVADPSSNCLESLKDIIATSSSGSHLSFELPNEDDEDKSCSDAFILGLSVQPEVCRVERKFRDKLFNKNAQWILQSHSEEERPFWDAGIKGQDQIVQVSDTGLDTDNCYFWDSSPGELKDGTVQSTRRKVVQYAPFVDNSDYERGHGTHVVGTIIGKKSVGGTVNSEEEGVEGNGVAIEGKVAFADVGLGSSLSIPNSAGGLFQPGIRAGAYVHSGSWGANIYEYDFRTKDYDDFMYNNEDYIALFAAGNSGWSGGKDTLNTIGRPSHGKNVISVGATESHGTGLGTDYIAYFSSRGKTSDGRIKPDIMAPGYAIKSAFAKPGQQGDCSVTYMAGTSMATPATSGATLLIRQYLQEGFYPTGAKVAGHEIPNPSGSLLKAILINGGQVLKGVNNGSSGITSSQMYDEHQGFGRVNLLNSLSLSGKNNLKTYIEDKVSISQSGSDEYEFKLVANPESTCEDSDTFFSATIVWADPAAATGCSNCQINDLDLLVESESQTFYPNGKTEKDSRNNVERIRIPYSAENNFTFFKLSVNAHNLATSSQKYALVVTGCGLAESVSSSPTLVPSETPSASSSPTSQLSEIVLDHLESKFEGNVDQNGFITLTTIYNATENVGTDYRLGLSDGDNCDEPKPAFVELSGQTVSTEGNDEGFQFIETHKEINVGMVESKDGNTASFCEMIHVESDSGKVINEERVKYTLTANPENGEFTFGSVTLNDSEDVTVEPLDIYPSAQVKHSRCDDGGEEPLKPGDVLCLSFSVDEAELEVTDIDRLDIELENNNFFKWQAITDGGIVDDGNLLTKKCVGGSCEVEIMINTWLVGNIPDDQDTAVLKLDGRAIISKEGKAYDDSANNEFAISVNLLNTDCTDESLLDGMGGLVSLIARNLNL